MLKPEQLQAVHHVYEGKDVFLWLLTGFVNPSAMKFSLVLRPSHRATICEGPGYIPHGQVKCTMFFTERKAEYVAHAQTVCTKPSPRFVGGAWVRGWSQSWGGNPLFLGPISTPDLSLYGHPSLMRSRVPNQHGLHVGCTITFARVAC